MDVLWATDGSMGSRAVALLLNELRLKQGDTVRVQTVVDCPMPLASSFCPWRGEEWLAGERHLAQALAREAAADLRLSGVRVETQITMGDPVTDIVAAAEKLSAHLVAVGATGRPSFAGLLLGGVARNLTRCCSRPVLVTRPLRNSLREILIAIDGSSCASRAVQQAVRLRLPEESRLTVVHVVRPYLSLFDLQTSSGDWLREEQQRAGRSLLDDANRKLAAFRKTSAEEILVGDPATELLRLAEDRGTDLIVCGARGVSAWEGLLVGSVADRLIREAPCSVLTVR